MNLSEKQIKNIKKAAEYKGRFVKLEPFRSGMSLASYWDEGSRYNYWLVNVDTGRSIKIQTNGGPFQRNEIKLENLEPNTVVAEVSIFRGKTSALRIYS